MSKYKHGIATSRTKTQMVKPTMCTNMIQVVVGTAPVNTLADPASAVNKPILLTDGDLVADQIGTTTEMERYTIEHAVYASFEKHHVAPIVVINVLDPANANHVEAVAAKEYTISNKMVKIEDTGILRDKVVVTNDSTECKDDVDYVTSFDSNGYLVIGIIDDGALASAQKINVTYAKLKPEGVAAEDIIGGVGADGKRTGLELLDEIYPDTGIIPKIALAPRYSAEKTVAVALKAKVEKIYGMYNAIAFVDMDSSSSGADVYTKVKKTKEDNVPVSRRIISFWPCVKAEGYVLSFSAFAAALLQKITAENADIPSESIDNRELLIDGICLENGSKVNMTQDEVNDYLNAYGVVGALKLPEWKAWGNNTSAYPDSEDPIDRWIKCLTMLDYLENKFKSDYLSKISRNASYKLIESIVSEFNMSLNSLVPDYMAGGEIVFDRKLNPITNVMAGHLKFQTKYADYVPAEYVENEFSYDVDILENSLEGGEA